MRCSNKTQCGGKYVIKKHEAFCKIWMHEKCNCEVAQQVSVIAMQNPIWVQCSECGVAPGLDKQGTVVGLVLGEVMDIVGGLTG
jgi:hypothetical protein